MLEIEESWLVESVTVHWVKEGLEIGFQRAKMKSTLKTEFLKGSKLKLTV